MNDGYPNMAPQGLHVPGGAQSRYSIPQFFERAANGEQRVMDPYAKLFDERIIFLKTQIDEVSANDVMAQLLVLESQDPDRDITIYINSPGGSLYDALGIYDTMQYVHCDVATVVLGTAASAAAILLAGGTPGKRAALPNSTVLIHQPRTGGAMRGQVSDLEIQAAEMERARNRLDEILASHTGQTVEQIRKDTDRDNILTADQAKEYGIVDTVFPYRKASAK
ncbi:ATP-dependent Clp protease proteolytic subunit OS=Tsukamurella paurometabola (strain ATCC 8368 / DSM / CCUG 35730 / CIP 100753 / JCM 10117 / KCTC 9821 /NBRC 16120 / NCIMB 702349 / NCTC 13040) OX=521096 GN=clpP PE=3 SV=1 [Tsukamurella paurometabola]|uniref:ATP-dependent Clp protease proteolytic subunit n=1 Tax=Tsukamurella paurometabola (strain ATCC 8368 / DSM 20162 / CCUG 35730 / CIP 100753 / JCM 10117 / KCTC 9821 / NBRC 16120 / NCIMB 702349 / NCTC 13040) TaxID=521096 RepID=D5UXJ7_TSUPD|nr:ATP-dependent Clp protease proteolytic subunit [Tsukamurella paurometabola]ADG78089.1 Endopeptidase Clp [Tsukamurella paurometabola DSM 20162]SUP30128.1 ATP-dependent Clp protease proteolytic subunit 1 [Tsukamurella paurometabola]